MALLLFATRLGDPAYIVDRLLLVLTTVTPRLVFETRLLLARILNCLAKLGAI